MAEKKKYDSTVARIAGNLLSGSLHVYNFNEHGADHIKVVRGAVAMARAIVAETERTEPEAK